MLAQRAVQQSMRRLATSKPTIGLQMAKKFAMPMAASQIQSRPVATQRMTPEDSISILAAQRKNRPTSPNLGIYRLQMTSACSALNRITGCILSGGFYVFGFSYLVAPMLGMGFSSASMAASFAAWPVVLKVLAKFLVALPFTFHSFNGVRHLLWDMGKAFTNAQVIKTGWIAIGAAVSSALALALFV